MIWPKEPTDGVQFGEGLWISFQRTLRIPDDGKTYPLPPGLGAFPVCKVEDYRNAVPESWSKEGSCFIPMYQREALWICFHCDYEAPRAVKVGVGRIDAITGRRLYKGLNKTRQNYVVVPEQPWLDGINAGDGYIRQFVAMPLGMGYSVEGQITGREEFGGIQIMVYKPKPNAIKPRPYETGELLMKCAGDAPSMGLGAGGKMKQDIYPDPYGIDVWNQDEYEMVTVHIVNSMAYRDITGMEPPPTPIGARMYTEYGLPWFDLYDEGKGDVKGSKRLKKVKTVKQMDKKKGFGKQQDDSSVDVPKGQVVKLGKNH